MFSYAFRNNAHSNVHLPTRLRDFFFFLHCCCSAGDEPSHHFTVSLLSRAHMGGFIVAALVVTLATFDRLAFGRRT